MQTSNINLQSKFRLQLLLHTLCLITILSYASLHRVQGLPRMTSDVVEVSGKSFDFIVVGGGTAGCPLAATLSEKFSVLLVERGGSPYGNPFVVDKKYYGIPLIQTDEFSSVVQRFKSMDGVSNSRGRVLGGSSAINGAFYSRASCKFLEDAGWDKELVEEAYEWVESKIVFTPELMPWQTEVLCGLLEAGVLPFNGHTLEHIEGTKIGRSIYDNEGRRHTSADLLEAANPENLVVLLNATVKKVIFHSNGAGNKPIVRGIHFIKSNGKGGNYVAYLNRPKNSALEGDVILSAGALGSPQILLLSGIGPSKHLESFNIPVVLDLKAVGEEMMDNPGIAILPDNITQDWEPEPPQVAGISKAFKFIIEAGVVPTSLNATTRRISAKIAFPESKGRLKLQSTDPRVNPAVKFNYFAEEKDVKECADMVQLLQKVANSLHVSFLIRFQRHMMLMSSPDELRQFCKENVRTYYHYHGGCIMGSVVDHDYRVYGVKGLRVVDGSTFHDSPGTNPMATILMLGRYQGVKILREKNINLSNATGNAH